MSVNNIKNLQKLLSSCERYLEVANSHGDDITISSILELNDEYIVVEFSGHIGEKWEKILRFKENGDFSIEDPVTKDCVLDYAKDFGWNKEDVKYIKTGEKSLLTIMRDCLETRGYEVTEEKLAELYGIYEDCQEWDDGEMLTGQSYDEVEDFVKHSPCVDEVFQKPMTSNKYYEVNDGWFTYYVNCETKEKKFKLDPGDVKVDRRLDDFYRGMECQ